MIVPTTRQFERNVDLIRGDIFSTSDVKQVILRDLDRFELVNDGL